MRINGWQRLWLLISFVSAVVVAPVAVRQYPERSEIDWQYERDMKELTAERIEAWRHLNKNNPYAGPEDLLEPIPKVISDGKARVNMTREVALRELPGKQWKFVLTVLASWLGFALLVYALGWLTAWTIRGFKEQSKPRG